MERKKDGIALRRTPAGFGSKKDELITAITDKLIVGKNETNSKNHKTSIPTQYDLAPIMRNVIQRSVDAEHMFNVLPDLELVSQVVISSILSTKDLITTTLLYEVTAKDFPLELRNKMLEIVKQHFDDEYKFASYLYDMLEDVLFKTGSYPILTLPESAIDSMINEMDGAKVSTEEFLSSSRQRLENDLRPKGFFGSIERNNSAVGLEALFSTPTRAAVNNHFRISDKFGEIVLIDNANHVKLNMLKLAQANRHAASAYNVNVAIEDIDGKAMQWDRSKYRRPQYKQQPIVGVKSASELKRPSVGHPLVMHLPSESVIPVHVPGDFKKHVAYLVVLDNIGNPVSRHDLMNNTQAWAWISGDASSQLLKEAAMGMGLDDTREDWTIAKLTNTYGELVEQRLLTALNNGAYGESVTITRPQEVYRIMMARAMARKGTQILCVPAEQLTYFALDFHNDGTGRSLTDKTRFLGVARAAVTFATMHASMLNATRNMQYDIALDENDREPEKTIDDAKHRIGQGYASRIPFTGSINDVEAYFANAGISFNVQGNQYYPSTKVSVSDVTPDYKVPDNDLSQDLARQHYRGFGADPDIIFTPESIEFARQVVAKDLIATKQICKTQEKLAPLLTHHAQNYVLSSGPLLKELAEAARDYLTEGNDNTIREGEIGHWLNGFINSLSVSLPAPDISQLASQMDMFEDEEKAIDRFIELFIDDRVFADGNMNLPIDKLKSLVANYLKRDWLRKNDVFPELREFFDDTERRQEFIMGLVDDEVKIAELLSMLANRLDKRLETVANNIPVETGDGGDGFGGDDTEFGAEEGALGDDADGGEFDNEGFDDDSSAESDEAADTDAVPEEDLDEEEDLEF